MTVVIPGRVDGEEPLYGPDGQQRGWVNPERSDLTGALVVKCARGHAYLLTDDTFDCPVCALPAEDKS